MDRFQHRREAEVTMRLRGFVKWSTSGRTPLFVVAVVTCLPALADDQIVARRIHTRTVSAVAVVGDYVVTSGSDGRVCTLSQSRLELLSEAKLSAQWGAAIATLPSAKLCAVACSDGSIQAYAPKSTRVRLVRKAHDDWVLSLVFKDEHTLVSGGRDHHVVLSRWPDGNLMNTFTDASFWVQALAVSKQGDDLAAGCWDGTVHLWSLAERRPIKSFQALGPHHAVLGLDFSDDGKSLYICGQEKAVRKWNTHTEQIDLEFTGHADVVSGMSRFGELLITASNDGTVRIWDTTTAAQYWVGSPDIGLLTCLAITQSGKHCYIGSREGIVARMALPTGK